MESPLPLLLELELDESLEEEVDVGLITSAPVVAALAAQVAWAGISVTPTPPQSFLANWAETAICQFDVHM